MHLKPAAPILGVVAVAALAVATYQFVWAPIAAGRAVPRTFTAEDLPTILLSDENAPAGFTVDEQGRETGGSALVMPLRPGGDAFDMTAFVDALSVTGGDDVGGYMTWAALFETPEAAGEAFDLVATEHDSPDGWGLASTRTDPGLGDESATWTGQQYDLVPSARTIFWREGNLLLAVVGFAEWNAGDVRALADAMADRAELSPHGLRLLRLLRESEEPTHGARQTACRSVGFATVPANMLSRAASNSSRVNGFGRTGTPSSVSRLRTGRRRGSAAPVHTMIGSVSQLGVRPHLLDHPEPEVLLVRTLEIHDQRLRPRLANGVRPGIAPRASPPARDPTGESRPDTPRAGHGHR